LLRYLLFVIGFVFVIWTAATSLTQVQPNQRAVIRRFGRILEQKPQQGLYVGLPWGIDRVDLVPIGVHSIKVGFMGKEDTEDEVIPAGQMLTGDHNLVNVQAEIYYRVREADMENYVLQKDQIDAFLSRAAESLLAEWVAGQKVDHVLQKGKIELPIYLHEELPRRLAKYELGVVIERANIDAQPPAKVKSDFDRSAHAQTRIKAEVNQALQETNAKADDASAKIFSMKENAKAYANEERLKADADAESFTKRLEQYRELSKQNPDYLNALWLDEITRLFTRMRENGRIELLDHFLSNGELTITQFPLPRKK
jgi:membrane protease subunit HflK